MNKSELIDKYLNQQLSPEELQLWDKLIQEDQDFREEALFHLELRRGIKRVVRQSLKERLQQLEASKMAKKRNSVRKLWPLLGRIAAVLVLGFGVFYLTQRGLSDETLYASYFHAYPNIVAPIVRDVEEEDVMAKQAFELYESKHYEEAALAFEDLYKTQQAPYAPFYQALSRMALGDTEQAIAILEDPVWVIPERLQIPQNWYLALAYLKQGDHDHATKYLQSVWDAGGFQAAEAREILEKIN